MEKYLRSVQVNNNNTEFIQKFLYMYGFELNTDVSGYSYEQVVSQE